MFALMTLLLSACAAHLARPLPGVAELTREAPRGAFEVEASHNPLVPAVAVDLTDGLQPSEAAVLAVLGDPELVALRAARGETAAQLLAAGLLPNPVFSGGLSVARGAGSAGTIPALSGALEWDLGAWVGRAARRAEGSAQLDSVDLDIAWQEWQVAQAARLGTMRWALLAQRRALVEAEVEFESETVRRLETALQHGDATVRALGVHRSALETQRQTLGDLRRAEVEQRAAVLLLLGLPPDTALTPVFSVSAGASWPALSAGASAEVSALDARLDLQALRLGYQAQEARIRQAVLARVPSVSVGVSADRGETGLHFLGGLVTLGLPFLDRQQAAVPLERATRERLRAEYVARVAQARSDLRRLSALDPLVAAQADSAHAGAVALQAIEAAERAGVESGDVDRMTWQDVRSTLLELRLRELELCQARLELRLAMEVASGSTLGSLVPANAE